MGADSYLMVRLALRNRAAQERLVAQQVLRRFLERVPESFLEQSLFLERTQAMQHAKRQPRFLPLQFQQPDF
jgi:hypothetical protein